MRMRKGEGIVRCHVYVRDDGVEVLPNALVCFRTTGLLSTGEACVALLDFGINVVVMTLESAMIT